ncbi:MAG TPA: hypothetical protein DCP85_00675 [Elusimicrobia bacterium]|nr:hypothetical protein [Elusimicrobiota bacterium]
MREESWNGKPRKLGPDAKARAYDPAVSLRNPKFVQKAILQALLEGDFEAVIDIYRAHLRVLNRTRTATALHVSRQYVHKMLKPSNTPSLRTFAAFMRLLAQEAAVK